MDIVISFKTTVGAVGTLRTVKEVAFDVINHSLVLWLNNKKFPTSWDESVNSRDVNGRLPPAIPTGTQYSFAYVGGSEIIKEYRSSYDYYYAENQIEGGSMRYLWPALYTEIYEKENDSFEGINREKRFNTIMVSPDPSVPLEPGAELLDVWYYEEIEGYAVSGSYAQRTVVTEGVKSNPLRISLSWYEQNYANTSTNPGAYQENSGVDNFGKPWSFRRVVTYKRRVFFAND